jgi:hypothetical protein
MPSGGLVHTPLVQRRGTLYIALLVVLLLALGSLGGTARSTPTASTGEVVIGSKDALPFGIGWGTVRPRKLHNGGVPSGIAFKIRWSSWGGRVVVGRGLNWIYTPHGGYYAKPVPIDLRAYKIGRCSPTGPSAYTRLKARAPSRPGGRVGRWSLLSGVRNLCDWSH